MKTALFKPLWEPFALLPVTENAGVNVPTTLAVRAVIMLDPSETQVTLRAQDIPEITTVRVDGLEVEYTISGTTLTVPTNLHEGSPQTGILEIERNADVTYTIFIGHCVPGIRIDNEGHLKGIVSNINSLTPKDYTFGIRAEWDGLSADVIKMWTANPVHSQLSWNFSTLPDATQDSDFVEGRAYYTLGELKRGQYVELGIDVINPDGTPVEFQLRPAIDMVVSETHFAALPLELTMTNNPLTFKGLVTAQSVPGDYFLELYTDEPLAPTPIVIHFRVLADSFYQMTPVSRLKWVSDSFLGNIREALPSNLSISAEADGPITYSIATGSRSLPVGLTLASNGEIRGLGPHIDFDQTITFTAKAVSGALFSEKEFSFNLVNTLSRRNYMTVRLPLSGPTRHAWQAYATQLPSELRYRSSDPSFPAAKPSITLIRGLTSRAIPDLKYDEPFWVILGPFKVAQVKNFNGEVIYDVIYRELIDPMARAGGFALGNKAIEVPEFYPQNRDIKLADASIRNLRYDLVHKVGLNSEPSKVKTLGLKGGELLDHWMTSIQRNGKALGYVAAGIVGYVLPNTGKELVEDLTYGDLPIGAVIDFDRMRVEDGTTQYFYYLGVDNDPDDIVPGEILAPTNLRVNGIPIANLRASQPRPIITWDAAQDFVLYTVRLYRFDGALLREISGIEGTTFDYTEVFWAADGNPSALSVEVTAIFENRTSVALKGSFSIRAGWDFGWGYVYGGEPLANGRRTATIAAPVVVASRLLANHVQPPHGAIAAPVTVEPTMVGVFPFLGAIEAEIEVVASIHDIVLGTAGGAIDVNFQAVGNHYMSGGPILAPVIVTPTLVGTYARPQRFAVLSAPIIVQSRIYGNVTFPSDTGAINDVIRVAAAMTGTVVFPEGTGQISAAVQVTPTLIGNHRITGVVLAPIDVVPAISGGVVHSGTINAAIQVASQMIGFRRVGGLIRGPIQVGCSMKGTLVDASTNAISVDSNRFTVDSNKTSPDASLNAPTADNSVHTADLG